MAQYTVQDIEIIRQKSGVSYEEAVNLLEYHNGSLARSLIDLEKNGRLKKSAAAPTSGKGVFNFLFRLRVKVSKRGVPVMNLSALFMLIALCVAPHVLLFALIASLVLGYRIHMERDSRDFERDSFDTIVKNAKTNVQSTVNDIASAFTRPEGHEDGTARQGAPQADDRDAPKAASEPQTANAQQTSAAPAPQTAPQAAPAYQTTPAQQAAPAYQTTPAQQTAPQTTPASAPQMTFAPQTSPQPAPSPFDQLGPAPVAPDPAKAFQPAQRSESAASGTRPVNVQFSEGERAEVKPDGDGYYEMDIK